MQTPTQTEIQTALDHVEITDASSEKLLPHPLGILARKADRTANRRLAGESNEFLAS
jgi:hypothetical protein